MKTPHFIIFVCGFIAASVFAQNPEAPFTALSAEQQRRFEIEVMEKIADLALIPPKLNTSPLP